MHVTGLVAVILIALAFDFTNGFHDSANAIATLDLDPRAVAPGGPCGGRGLQPARRALFSPKVAKTIGSGIIDPGQDYHLLVILARRAARRHRVEPHHLVLRAAVVVDPLAHRRAGRRGLAVLDQGALARHRRRRSSSRWCVSPLVGFVGGAAWSCWRSCGPSDGPSPGRSTAASAGCRPCRPPPCPSPTACRTPRRRWASSPSPCWPATLAGVRRAALGQAVRRRRDRARHLLRRLAHHPYPGAPHHQDGPAAGLRGRRHRGRDPDVAARTRRRPSRPRTSSRPRSWGSARPTGCRRCAGAWPRTIVAAWILTIPAAGLVAAGVYGDHQPDLRLTQRRPLKTMSR